MAYILRSYQHASVTCTPATITSVLKIQVTVFPFNVPTDTYVAIKICNVLNAVGCYCDTAFP